jgi:hypothetical protein
MEEDDDPLAIIIRKACSRELTDLGLVFNSLNIKVVQSEVAEARRRQSAAEVDTMDLVDIQSGRAFAVLASTPGPLCLLCPLRPLFAVSRVCYLLFAKRSSAAGKIVPLTSPRPIL